MSSNGMDVESKVVELSFRNSQFEMNAKTSISTLGKLKNALDMSKNAKIFDEIDKGVKKVNVGALSSGIETLGSKLKTLGSVAAFAMIADEAIKAKNAVEGFVKSVTLDQVSAGFDKYAEKTSAVQTIMAATAKEYSSTEEQMADVNAQLEKLNWFTDETSYSFLDMVNNIGKFTSNNIKLDTSVTAMQGISTWAAVSGANIQEAGRAMYNLSQAVATGSVKLMDWKSIENANMATAEFKETAIDTAVALGTLTKEADGTFKTIEKGTEVSVSGFNQTLSEGWFTSDVLLQTLEKYGGFTDELYGLMEKVNGDATTSEVLEFLDQYKEGSIDFGEASEAMGMSVSQLKKEFAALSDDALNLGIKAFKAAQEAKTFGEAVDSVKDAVSTGWMNTFETLFGDYTEAKVLWTELAEDLWDIFASGGETRNKLLKEAFNTQAAINETDWAKLEESGLMSPEFVTAVRQAASAHDASARSIIDNETWLQNALRIGVITLDDMNSAYEKVYGGGGSAALVDENIKSTVTAAQESDAAFSSLLETLSQYDGEGLSEIAFGDGQVAEGAAGELEKTLDGLMQTLGLTQEQGEAFVAVLQDMGYLGGKTSETLSNLSDDQKSAWEELQEVKKSVGDVWTDTLISGMKALVSLFKTVGDAWHKVFPPMSESVIVDFVNGLHNAVEGFSEFVSESGTLHTALVGIFTVLSIIKDVATTVGKTAFGVLRAVFGGLSIDIDGLVNGFTGLVTKFREWIDTTGLLQSAGNFVINTVEKGAKAVRGWIDAFLKLPIIGHALTNFKSGFKQLSGQVTPFFDGMKDKFSEFRSKIASLDGINLGNIFDIFTAFKETVIDYFTNFKGFDGFKKAFKVLKRDIKAVLDSLGVDTDKLKSKLEAFSTFFQGIPAKLVSGFTLVKTKVTEFFKSFSDIPSIQTSFSKFQEGFSDFGKNFGEYFKSGLDGMVEFIKGLADLDGFSFKSIIDKFKGFGSSIAGYFSNFPGLDGIKSAVVSFAEGVKEQFNKFGIDLEGVRSKVVEICNGIVQTIMSIVERLTGFKLPKQVTDIFGGGKKKTGSISGGIIGNILETVKTLDWVPDRIKEFVDTITPYVEGMKSWLEPIAAIVVAFASLKALKALKSIVSGVAGAITTGITTLFETATTIINNYNNVLKSQAKANNAKAFREVATGVALMAAAIFILAQAVKTIESFDQEKLPQTITILAGFATGLAILAKALSSMKGLQTAGVGILAIVASLYLLLGVFKILDGFELKNPEKVVLSIIGMLGLISLMFLTTKLAGKNGNDSAKAILAISASFVILAIAMRMISGMSVEDLAKGIIVIGILSIMFAGLMAASKLASGSALTIAALALVINSFVIALAVLSFIDEEKLQSATIALAVVMAVGAIFTAVAGFAGKGGAAAIAAFALAVGVIAYSLYQLAQLKPEQALVAVGTLTATFIAFSVMLGVLTAVGAAAPMAIAGVAVLGALMMTIGTLGEYMGAGIAGMLNQIGPAIEAFATSLLPLNDITAVSFDGLKTIVTSIGDIAWGEILNKLASIFTGQDPIELFKNQLPKLAEAIGVYADALPNITNMDAVEKSAVITALLADITKNKIPAGGLLAIVDGGLFKAGDFGVSLANLAKGVGKYAETVASMTYDETAITNSAKMITLLSTITKEEIPNGGLLSLIDGGLFKAGAFGDQLVDLATGVGVYAAVVTEMPYDQTAVDNSGYLIEMLAKLTEKEIPDGGIIGWIHGNADKISDFATQLPTLAAGLSAYASTINATSFDDTKTEASRQMATMLADLASNNIQDGGFIGMLTGNDSKIIDFAKQLPALAMALMSYATIIGVAEFDQTKTDASGYMATMLADLANKSIPTGGFIGKLQGNDSKIIDFAKQLKPLAEALTDYMKTINTSEFNASKVGQSKALITILSDLANTTIPDNGVLDQLFGDGGSGKIGAFGENIKELGEGLAGYSEALTEDIKSDKIAAAKDALSGLGDVATDLREMSGIDQNNILNFGSNLGVLGTQIDTLRTTFEDTDEFINISKAIQQLVGVMILITDESSSLNIQGDITNEELIGKFKDNVQKLVDAINGLDAISDTATGKLTSAMADINSADISGAVDKMTTQAASNSDVDMSDSGAQAGASMANGMASGVADNAGAVTDAIGSLTSSAAESVDKRAFELVGKNLAEALARGMSDSSAPSEAASSMGSSAVSSISSDGAYDVGYNISLGFANGIAGGANQAINAAIKLAVDAINAAKEKSKVRSPSKVMYEIGMFFTMGFANGIADYTGSAVKSSTKMADKTIEGMKEAIKTAKDILGSDVDGDPVIRPVLDLSEVRSGSRALQNLMGLNRPVRLAGDLGTINANSLAIRNRATNDDLYSAFMELKNDPSIGGNTYNVNGITYDDGSNVATAVKSLIHAARVERRS